MQIGGENIQNLLVNMMLNFFLIKKNTNLKIHFHTSSLWNEPNKFQFETIQFTMMMSYEI
jgi:hypothetical protein